MSWCTLALVVVLVCIWWAATSRPSESFVSDSQKRERAAEVVAKAGGAFSANPELTYGQFRALVPDGDAVEYRDMKSGTRTAEGLAQKW